MKYLILLLLVFSSNLLASEKEILELEMNYLKAWGDTNTTIAEVVLHENYHYVGADGERHSRDWTIDMIRSGRLIYSDIDISQGPVHRLGDTLVTLGTLSANGTWDGEPMVDNLAFTMVWVRQGENWALISEHNSRTHNPTE